MSGKEEKAVQLYNEACDMLEGSDHCSTMTSTTVIIELLERTIHILTEMHSEVSPLPGASTSVLLARACILLGQLVEWEDHSVALANYTRAVDIDPANPEAYVQLGRCKWKNAVCADDLRIVEEHLRSAIALCEKLKEKEDEGSFDGDDMSDPTLNEANNLLARLLSQSPGREAETKEFLASIGYKYTLAHWLTSSPVVPEQLASSHKVASKRLQNANVCAFDNILPLNKLQYLQQIFASDSPFWPEHGYDSPTSGFFSYQMPLTPLKHRLKSSTPMTSFESVVHSIWDTAQEGMPKLNGAKYAEWWCHSRSHCNGHKLHYDFVMDEGTTPRFPIASSVTFVTADCGGPTLVTDQRVNATSPLTHQGWIVHPATNRLVCFNGSLLHCVLPGQGPSPSVDARRVTFMIAFWEEDPRAPLTPSSTPHSSSKTSSSSCSSRNLKWPSLLTQPIQESVSWAESETDVPVKSNKRKATPINEWGLARKSNHSNPSTPLINNKVVILVDPVVEIVTEKDSGRNSIPSIQATETETKKEQKELRNKRRGVKRGVDLLEDEVFTYFEALNSGLVLSGKGICSLNCGGTCSMCKQLAAANVGIDDSE